MLAFLNGHPWLYLFTSELWALGEAFPLLYVVSYKVFWNGSGVVRFVSQEVWFDKGFVIWNFLDYSLVQTMSLRSLSIRVEIIFTTNELVDIIRNFKSNAFQFGKNLYEKNTPQARFLWYKMRRRQDLSNKMRRRPDFLMNSQWVLCPICTVCNLYFTNHRSKASSFSSLIH